MVKTRLPLIDRVGIWVFEQRPRPGFGLAFWSAWTLLNWSFHSKSWEIALGYVIWEIAHFGQTVREYNRDEDIKKQGIVWRGFMAIDDYKLLHFRDKAKRN